MSPSWSLCLTVHVGAFALQFKLVPLHYSSIGTFALQFKLVPLLYSSIGAFALQFKLVPLLYSSIGAFALQFKLEPLLSSSVGVYALQFNWCLCFTVQSAGVAQMLNFSVGSMYTVYFMSFSHELCTL